MATRLRRFAALVTLVCTTSAQPALAAGMHHLTGGGTASISQVALNVAFDGSGGASGQFECLMAGRSAFILAAFPGLDHNMIVHATPSSGAVSGTVARFSGPGRLTLDGSEHIAIHVQVQVDIATQTFQLTVLEVGAMPVETMQSGQLSLH